MLKFDRNCTGRMRSPAEHPTLGGTRHEVVRLLASLCFVALLFGAPLADTAAQNNAPTSPTPTQVIQFLSQTIDWYRQSQQEQHIATEPVDLGFLADNRRMAAQIVRLSFDFARQEEQQQRAAQTKPGSVAAPNANASQYDSLVRAANDADRKVQETQSELDSLKKPRAAANSGKRRQLDTQVAELQSELALFQARQQALHSMLEFAGSASGAGGGTSLRAQIEELARAVPPALSGTNGNETTPAPEPQSLAKSNSGKSSPSGMWALTAELFRLSSKRSTLSNDTRATDALTRSAKDVRAPLIALLKELIQRGNEIATQADTSDQDQLAAEKKQLDALTADFKQLSLSSYWTYTKGVFRIGRPKYRPTSRRTLRLCLPG